MLGGSQPPVVEPKADRHAVPSPLIFHFYHGLTVLCLYQAHQTSIVPHGWVLPPGELKGTIAEPLAVYSQSYNHLPMW